MIQDCLLLTFVDIGSLYLIDFVVLSITFCPWLKWGLSQDFRNLEGSLQNAIEDKYCEKNAI